MAVSHTSVFTLIPGARALVFAAFVSCSIRKTQEGYGGLGGENPGAFQKSGEDFRAAIFLAGKCSNLGGDSIWCCWKSKFGGKLCQQGLSDSHSLLEFSDSNCEFRASIARTPFCAILWHSPNLAVVDATWMMSRFVTRHFPYRPTNPRKFKDTKKWSPKVTGQSDAKVTQK